MTGELIADRYELGERLGVGGMSTVRVALDRRLERQVAVKLLAEHLADDPQFVSRFRREALAAARLVHPNIVQVFDFGLDEPSGRHYIVMEHIKGRSGAQILRDEGQLGIADTLRLDDGACRALHYAHQHGVVHRDVKPGNLLVSDEGAIKLADFGIAKASDVSSITQVGSVLGTAAYLAPEQAHGERATPRSDIYGLGVVTYQLLSGRLPYEAASLPELALAQQRERPAPLQTLNPDVSPGLSAAVSRALELEPERRYASAEEMRTALANGGAGLEPPATDATQTVRREPTASTRVVTGGGPPAQRRLEPRQARPAPAPTGWEADPRPAPAPARPRRSARRRARGTLIALLVLLLLAGAAAAVYFGTSPGSERVQIREIGGNDVQGVVDDLERLIDDNLR